MTKEQIAKQELNGEEIEFFGDSMGNLFDCMETYKNQELVKERERYDNLYSQFEELCRQIQINKDKLERYENAYMEEINKNIELTQALEAKLRDDLRQSEIF